MTEKGLLIAILILLVLLIGVWISILYSLVYRRKKKRIFNNIEETFSEIVSFYLYPNKNELVDIVQINRRLQAAGIRPGKNRNIQHLIRLMIRTQRTILGENYKKLQKLYLSIPPYRASYKKLKRWSWYSKAKGIREIYEMDQSQYVDEIFKLRNHRNIYVRREAQIALVVFMGWESLRFLPYLKRKITLWQQIKIVEKLHYLYPTPNLKWLHKAYKTDKVYAKQLLMRIIRKFELHQETDYILGMLNDADYELRETAIYCIQTFALPNEKMEFVKKVYEEGLDQNHQILLLRYIYENSDFDLDFYVRQLYSENDELKLSVAEILWNNGHKEKVQEFYLQQYQNQSINVG